MDEYVVIAFAAYVRNANFCNSPAVTLFSLMNRAWELGFSLEDPYWKELLRRIGVNPRDIIKSAKTFIPNRHLQAAEKYRKFIKWLEEEQT